MPWFRAFESSLSLNLMGFQVFKNLSQTHTNLNINIIAKTPAVVYSLIIISLRKQ